NSWRGSWLAAAAKKGKVKAEFSSPQDTLDSRDRILKSRWEVRPNRSYSQRQPPASRPHPHCETCPRPTEVLLMAASPNDAVHTAPWSSTRCGHKQPHHVAKGSCGLTNTPRLLITGASQRHSRLGIFEH